MQTVLECTVVAEQLWQTHPEQSPQLWQLLQQWPLTPGSPGTHNPATRSTSPGNSAIPSRRTPPDLPHNRQGTLSPEVKGKTVLIEITEHLQKSIDQCCSQPSTEVVVSCLSSGETVPRQLHQCCSQPDTVSPEVQGKNGFGGHHWTLAKVNYINVCCSQLGTEM